MVGLDEADALGLFNALQIRACAPVSRSKRHTKLLGSLGASVGQLHEDIHELADFLHRAAEIADFHVA